MCFLGWKPDLYYYAFGAHVSIQCSVQFMFQGFHKKRKPYLKEKNLRNFDIENGNHVQEYILWKSNWDLLFYTTANVKWMEINAYKKMESIL